MPSTCPRPKKPQRFEIPVIAIAGLKGSGKSTVAKIIERHIPDTLTLGFADQIKKGLLAMLEDSLDYQEICDAGTAMWGETHLRQQPISDLTKNDGTPLTYRHCLQTLGDILRQKWHKDIHIELTLRRIAGLANAGNFGCICLPDLRYSNEADAIRRAGGQVWRIRRGYFPLWREAANVAPLIYKIGDVLGFSPHPSEREMYYRSADRCIDVSIDNNGSLSDLENKIALYLRSFTWLKRL